MKKFLLISLLCCLGLTAQADVMCHRVVGGLVYYINETKGTAALEESKNYTSDETYYYKEGETQYGAEISYAGAITVPAEITYLDKRGEETTKTAKVTQIYANVFSGNTAITSISIGENVTEIGNNAFVNCSNLTKVIFHSLEKLCAMNFLNSKYSNPLSVAHHLYFSNNPENEVTSVDLTGITEIKQFAFAECWHLTNITIPNSVTTIGNDAFVFDDGVSASKTFPKTVFESVESLCKTDFKSQKSNPIYYQHNVYTQQKAEAFTTVTIPVNSLRTGKVGDNDNGKFLGANIFVKANKLISVEIPEETDSIAPNAFLDCTALQVAIFPSLNYVSGDEQIRYGNEYSNPLRYAANLSIGGSNQSELTFSSPVPDNAFPSAKWLKKVTFNSGVTSIGNDAFKGCTALTSVTFATGSAPLTIGDRAFHSCENLPSVTLPDGVTALGEEAFRNCKLITSITIPSACTKIDIGVFRYCALLKTVEVKSQITELPNLLFSNCYNLNSLTLPSTIDAVGENAFEDCRALKEIPSLLNLTTIGNNAFKGCTGLTNLVLPDKTASIGTNAFQGCNKITSVTLPASMSIISSGSFIGCTSLVQVFSLKETVVSADPNDSFENPSLITLYVPNETARNNYKTVEPWRSFKEIVIIQEATLHFYINDVVKTEWDITLNPGTAIMVDMNKKAETLLSEGDSFSGWDKEIPETMPNTSMDFYGYISYKREVDGYVWHLFPKEAHNNKEARATVISITDDKAESPEISVPATVNYDETSYPLDTIGTKAFEGRTKIQRLTLPDGLKAIESAAFKGCSGITQVKNFPNDLTTISDSLFLGCSSLAQIQVKETTESSNSLPTTIASIGREAFKSCGSFALAEFPASLTTIGYQAFNGTAFKEIKLPSSITTLGNEIFKECKNLKTVTFEDGFNVAVSDLTFWLCSALDSIVFSPAIPSINQGAFKGCSSLANITIPNSVTFIGNEAFVGCSNLAQITEEREEPPFAQETAFDASTYENTILYVPEDSYDAYHSADTWKRFTKLTKGAEYELRYVLDGVKDETRTKMIKAGALIEPASKPEKGNRMFSGWKGEPKVMPAEPVEVTGSFKYAVTYYKDDAAEVKNKIMEEADSFYYNKNIVIPVDVLKKDHEAEKFTIKFIGAMKGEEEGQWKDIEVKQDDVETAEIAIPAKDITAIVTYTLSEKVVSYGMVNYKVYLLENRAEVISSPEATGNIEIPATISVKVSESSEEYQDFPVTVIQENAFNFEGSQKITGMVLPEGIVSIGKRAFYDNRFTTITIPASVKTIGSEAFRNCTTMETAYFAEGSPVTELAVGVFQGCLSLKTVTLPSQLQTIAAYGFDNCPQLEVMTLPSTLKLLDVYAFAGCKALAQFTVNAATPPAAPSSSFATEAYNNAKVYVASESLSSYKEHATWGQFKNFIANVAYKLTYKVDGNVYVKDEQEQVLDVQVGTVITPMADAEDGSHQFSGWSGEPSIMPAEDVVVTGAFKYGLTYYQKTIDDDNKLKEDAFFCGDKLVVPVEILKKDHETEKFTITFQSAKKGEEGQWQDIILGQDDVATTDILMPAKDITAIVSYDVSEADYTDESNALVYKIMDMNDPEKKHAELVSGKGATGEVAIPSSITYKEVVYPVTVIQNDAFKNNLNIVDVTIPSSVTTMGTDIFVWCTKLEGFVLEANITTLPSNTFQNCVSLKAANIPEQITAIGSDAFSGCNDLKEVILPATLTGIGERAFYGALGDEASLTLKAASVETLPTAAENSFNKQTYQKTNLQTTLSEDALKDVDVWKEFENVVPADESGITQQCAKPVIEFVVDKDTKAKKLQFSCATGGATIVYDINVADNKSGKGTETTLTRKYIVTAYARKSGLIRSETATATYNWYMKGDTNNDGKVTISDAVGVVNIILNDPNAAAAPELEPEEAPEEQAVADPE